MTEAAIRQLAPDAAYSLLQEDVQAVLLDVRSTLEYHYVGHPVGAVHVAWMEPPQWHVNPAFVEQVRAVLTPSGKPLTVQTPLLTLCRSGKRSQAAAEALTTAGFAKVYNIIEGFEGDLDASQHRSTLNGWRFRGLPWVQT